MAFENVNVASMRNAINSCIGKLNKEEIQELTNNISNSSVWEANAQDTLKKALTRLGSIRYIELEQQLINCYEIVNYIEEYQNINSTNESLFKEYSSLDKKLYYTENYIIEDVDENGNKIKKECTRKVKDSSVEKQMDTIKKEINENRNTMENLKNNISNAL